eukprot:2721465-Rhodomonas_salina.2
MQRRADKKACGLVRSGVVHQAQGLQGSEAAHGQGRAFSTLRKPRLILTFSTPTPQTPNRILTFSYHPANTPSLMLTARSLCRSRRRSCTSATHRPRRSRASSKRCAARATLPASLCRCC